MRKSFTRLFLVAVFFVASAIFFNNAQAVNRTDSSPPMKAQKMVGLNQSLSFVSFFTISETPPVKAITNVEVSAVKKGFGMDSNFTTTKIGAVVFNRRGETTHILKHPYLASEKSMKTAESQRNLVVFSSNTV